MPNANYEELLEKVGFLPSEVKVYLAALELGSTSVQNIAKKAQVSRTAAYEAIEGLQKRGLMTSTMRGKRRVYASEDPERIVSFLKEEHQRFESTLSDIQRSLDAMKLMAGGIKPAVRSYEGEEALHAYFSHLSEIKPKNMIEMTNVDDVYHYFSAEQLLSARKNYDFVESKSYRLIHCGELRNPRKGIQFREWPRDLEEFHGNIAVYDKYLAMSTYVGKPATVIIESEVLANTMKSIFEVVWERSAK